VRFYTARTNLWRGDIWGESMIWKAAEKRDVLIRPIFRKP
jgi:hypothetical protein